LFDSHVERWTSIRDLRIPSVRSRAANLLEPPDRLTVLRTGRLSAVRVGLGRLVETPSTKRDAFGLDQRQVNDLSTQGQRVFTDEPSDRALTPDILFIDDIPRLLRTSRPTIERRGRERSFPIPEVQSIDKRPRWRREDVLAFLTSSPQLIVRRRSVGRSKHQKIAALARGGFRARVAVG
jgi:hypothetical protein